MAIFTVHTPEGEPFAAEKIIFLRDGFSFPAFIFGPFWLAWNRAFLAAGGWFALLLFIGVAGAKLGASQQALSLVSLALSLGLGFEGVRLVAWTLERRGLRESAVIVGENADEAEEIYFHNRRAVVPPPPPPPPMTGAGEKDRL